MESCRLLAGGDQLALEHRGPGDGGLTVYRGAFAQQGSDRLGPGHQNRRTENEQHTDRGRNPYHRSLQAEQGH